MTPPKFLIDENLSVTLPARAHARGYECAHVVHRGFHTWKDWSLLEAVAREDWILVTNNAIEFRGRFREIDLHPSVIFLVPSVRRDRQAALFDAVLDEVDRDPDLLNTALDADYEREEIVVRRYRLP